MFDLIAILIPIIFAFCIIVGIKIIDDGRVRRRLIDTGADETIIKAIMSTEHQQRRHQSFKWGVVLCMIGAGFASMWVLGLDANDPLSYALLFACTGIGLLVYRRLDPPRQ